MTSELQRLREAADLSALPRAWGEPLGVARLRTVPEDFQVVEIMPDSPSGEGEHLWIRLRKTGQNTNWVAGQLARGLNVSSRDVGYAGLKDRHAVTEQWFSVWLPGAAEIPELPPIEGVEYLEALRSRAKLRRGELSGNRFVLRLRGLSADPAAVADRLAKLAEAGVPNYFGAQRFGRESGNLTLLDNRRRLPRHQRSLALSALRSALFNGYLARRLEQGTWNQVLPGDVVSLPDDPRPVTVTADTELPDPVAGTGWLAGDGDSRAADAVAADEQAWFSAFPETLEKLRSARLKPARRELVLFPEELDFSVAGDQLELAFALPAGSFATVVLREIVEYVEAPPTPS